MTTEATPGALGSNDQLCHTVPKRMQHALENLLEQQFRLGVRSAQGSRPSNVECKPAADALQGLCDLIGLELRKASSVTARALVAKNEAESRELQAAQEADELRALADSEGTRAVEYLRRAKKAEAEVKKLRDAALWALMHHQGGSSPVGQPLRKALGIPPHADLTQEQFNAAKVAAGIWGPNGA